MTEAPLRVQTPDPYVEAWIRFAQARGVLGRLQERFFSETELTREEYRVLIVLTNVPDQRLTQNELARWLYRRPNTVSEQAVQMERRGLVKRERDPQDRRAVYVCPTERGRRLCQEVTEVTHAMIREVMQDMRETEVSELVSLLDKLIQGATRYLQRRQGAEDQAEGEGRAPGRAGR